MHGLLRAEPAMFGLCKNAASHTESRRGSVDR